MAFRAIRVRQFGDPEVMHLEMLAEPVPAPNEVLLRVHAAGVDPVDAYIRTGTYAAVKPDLPYTPGRDCAGIVAAVGTDIAPRWEVGARVYTDATISGAYAEFALCGPEQIHPLPDNVTFEQGAALGVPYGTAYRALFQRGKVQAGETVLVHGATGGVGIAAVELARAAGLRVIGTGGTEQGRALALDHGPHYMFDHHAPDYPQQIMQLTGGRGVDIVLEMLANVNLGTDLTLLAPYGRVVIIGSRGSTEINPRDAMGREADIRGLTLLRATSDEIASIHAAVVAGLENGSLNPVVGHELPLDEAAKAHHRVMEPGAHGKIVLKM